MNSQRTFQSLLVFLTLIATTSCGDGAKGDINYVALGASDTTGVGATPITNGYAYLIEQGLEEESGEKVDLDNLGIPAAKIGDIDNLEVQLLKLSNPDLITISVGANDIIDGDSTQGFDSDLNGLLGKLRSISPDAIIVISTVPNLIQAERFIKDPDADVTTARITSFNGAIAKQAAVHNAKLVDLYPIPLTDSLTSEADGFHPNDRGHRAMADEFLKVIKPLTPQLVAEAS